VQAVAADVLLKLWQCRAAWPMCCLVAADSVKRVKLKVGVLCVATVAAHPLAN
jgi:hypothetical protein